MHNILAVMSCECIDTGSATHIGIAATR